MPSQPYPAMPLRRRLPALGLSALLLAQTAVPAPQLTEGLPDLGDVAGSYLTPAEEQRLGQAFMRSVRASEKVVDDPLLETYIQDLGSRLVAHSSITDRRFDFFLIDSPVINAFAGPDGHIGVFTGLLLTTETESELAAVLAHEIAHVSQHHLLRSLALADQLTIPQVAVVLAAAVLGVAAGGDAAIAAAVGGQAGIIQEQINFTRDNEQEADSIGISLLADSGYEPRAMATFFDRMGRANRSYAATEVPEFLRTHPVTNNRIADALSRSESYPYKHPADDLRYQLIRASLRVKGFATPAEAVEHYRDTYADGRYRNATANRYGYALALMRAERYAEARKVLNRLLAKHPTTVEFLVTSARLYTAAGQLPQALAELTDAQALFPTSYPINVSLAEVRLQAGQARAARDGLQPLLARRPDDARLLELMARASQAMGQPIETHEYMAEKYFISGDTEAAVLQLEIALRDPRLNDYESARLGSRLKALKRELKEEKKREKRL